MTDSAAPWTIAVDRGGTFTDLIAVGADGRVEVAKLPSVGDGLDGVAAAVRRLVGAGPGPIPGNLVSAVRCGTTVATNALLTRRGERCALLVTRGFGDLLGIDDQTRPELFELDIQRPRPLTDLVIEIDERVLADGTVRTALDEAAVRRAGERLLADGVRSVAVAFVHAAVHPEHERRAAEILREVGLETVVASSEGSAEPRLLPRCRTAVADAFLTPLLRRALRRFREEFAADVEVGFLESHGGLVPVADVSGPRSVLSGPAGGVVATAAVAQELDLDAVVGFDMGGTSTDVSRFAGELEHARETSAGGVRLQVPALRIETVAAGGGSVIDLAGGRLVVGPESAGADPGPAGYGRGGPATLTDAAAVLGLIRPELYPAVFGAAGDQPFDVEASRVALADLAHRLEMTPERLALDARRVAVQAMADAIDRISVARGHDVRRHALVCFGGAGPQVACALADALGITEVVVPRHAAVFSAAGIASASEAREFDVALTAPWTPETADRAHAPARAHGTVGGRDARVLVHVELRERGTDEPLAVPLDDHATTERVFRERYRARYGFEPTAGLECVRVRVRVEHRRATALPGARAGRAGGSRGTAEVVVERSGEVSREAVPLVVPGELDTPRAGPVLVADEVTSLFVAPGWEARSGPGDHLRLRRVGRPAAPRVGLARDATGVALVAGAFRALADRMGSVLERTAHSTNVKERRDFSCALFDGDGRLVVNAPHVPVHLGAMGASVRAVATSRGRDLVEGDVILTNDPYRGGSHLPDVTAVTPVLVRDGRARFWVASRAHHADVGGRTPGSMPALSATLDEEGVCLHDVIAVRDGEWRVEELRHVLARCRGLDERLADLRAQATANATGARRLRRLCDELGEDVVVAHAGYVVEDGRTAVRIVLDALGTAERSAHDALDDGTPLAVTLRRVGERLVVDFTGTGAAPGTNLHAPAAVVHAAVLYVLRCLMPPSLTAHDVPLNEGCLADIDIVVPEGSLLDPRPPAAVVGGNVETSMRLVDLLLAALGRQAGSQGTMNNVTFGDAEGAYYETLGGGAGASAERHGASGVHSHMTNTRITDVEVLERRWPVVVRRFALRAGSGGEGRCRGGDGLVRELEFLRPLQAGVLSGRRDEGGGGLEGGGPGARGRNVLVRDGVERELPARTELDVVAGDVLRIETPGGGGVGG